MLVLDLRSIGGYNKVYYTLLFIRSTNSKMDLAWTISFQTKNDVAYLFWAIEFYFRGGGLILTVPKFSNTSENLRKFPNYSGNSRVLPEISEWLRKFSNILCAFRNFVAYTLIIHSHSVDSRWCLNRYNFGSLIANDKRSTAFESPWNGLNFLNPIIITIFIY